MRNENIKLSRKQELVTDFFDGWVEGFYSIYDKRTLFSKILNNLFRGSMHKRFSVSRELIIDSGSHS